MTFPKEKESQEPLTQQLRVLQKAAYEFIDIKKRDRVSWHSIEYIYSYYTKYLWGRNHKYDFEGELLDYLKITAHPSILTKFLMKVHIIPPSLPDVFDSSSHFI